LISPPAVALQTDAVLINKAFTKQTGDPAHNAIVGTLSRIALAVDHVRIEDDVALANVMAIVDTAPPGHRHAVAIYPFAAAFVEVDEQGILFLRVKAVGLNE